MGVEDGVVSSVFQVAQFGNNDLCKNDSKNGGDGKAWEDEGVNFWTGGGAVKFSCDSGKDWVVASVAEISARYPDKVEARNIVDGWEQKNEDSLNYADANEKWSETKFVLKSGPKDTR